MNFENKQLIENHKQAGDLRADDQEWGEAKVCYLRALEEFDRITNDEPEVIITADDELLKSQIEKAMMKADFTLAGNHFKRGQAAFENREYGIAVEACEEAIGLAPEPEIQFLEEVKLFLDKARVKLRDHKTYQELSPVVKRGDGFFESGNYAEAMIEYKDAFKAICGFSKDHRFVTYIKARLLECRRQLIKPYLSRVHRAVHAGKHLKAFSIINRVSILLDDSDGMYKAFVRQIMEEIEPKLTNKEIEEREEFESPEVWSEAVKDYEEALNLYSSYSDVDPLAPAYTGSKMFEDKFLNARRNLAKLYKNRGDRFRDQAQLQKAIRNYKEALKLFPKSDSSFHETFSQMKKLRSQLISSEENGSENQAG